LAAESRQSTGLHLQFNRMSLSVVRGGSRSTPSCATKPSVLLPFVTTDLCEKKFLFCSRCAENQIQTCIIMRMSLRMINAYVRRTPSWAVFFHTVCTVKIPRYSVWRANQGSFVKVGFKNLGF